ncbi:MAG: UxaA family hydrolase [Burkholderiaceae bacterium]
MTADTLSLLLLSEQDNVLVVRRAIAAGESVGIDGRQHIQARPVALGHKIARVAIAPGEKILKYGAPIGVATQAIAAGEHVHVHNMRSDYTPSYVLSETETGEEQP